VEVPQRVDLMESFVDGTAELDSNVPPVTRLDTLDQWRKNFARAPGGAREERRALLT